MAQDLLAKHHIPCAPGGALGWAKVDLVAWGCIPIEAKASKPVYVNQDGTIGYEFAFTRSQVNNGVPGLVILFACKTEDDRRWFVLPGNSELIVGKGHLAVPVDSSRSALWKRLEPYEERLDLIEHMRLQYVAMGKANEYRPSIERGKRNG